MSWFFFAILSTLLITFVNFGDKFVVESQVPNPLALLVYLSIFNGVAAIILWGLSGFFLIPQQEAFLIVLAGTAPAFAGFFYFQAVSRTEASRIVVLGQLGPVFTLVLSMIFLGELLSWRQFIGFGLILFAALAVTTQVQKAKVDIKSEPIWDVLFLMVMTNLIYAGAIILADSLIENLVMQESSVNWQALLGVTAYASLGYFLAGMGLLLFVPRVRHAFFSRVRITPLKAVVALSGVESIFIVRLFVFYLALSLGPASLVTVVGSLNVFFAVFIGWILTLWQPHIFKEDISAVSLISKLAWAAVAFVGILLLG